MKKFMLSFTLIFFGIGSQYSFSDDIGKNSVSTLNYSTTQKLMINNIVKSLSYLGYSTSNIDINSEDLSLLLIPNSNPNPNPKSSYGLRLSITGRNSFFTMALKEKAKNDIQMYRSINRLNGLLKLKYVMLSKGNLMAVYYPYSENLNKEKPSDCMDSTERCTAYIKSFLNAIGYDLGEKLIPEPPQK